MTAPIELVHHEGKPWVRLCGEIGMQLVAARAHDLYSHTCDGNVTVDLADVAAMDGAGLTVLLMVLRAADSVRLVNVPPAVRSLVDVSGSADVLEVVAA